MSKVDFLNSIFNKQRSQDEFNFDNLMGPGIYNYFNYIDVQNLHSIATSLKYSANIKAKYQAIDAIMQTRGFKRFAGGTNRVVYKCLDNPKIVAKVAIDRVGMGDNPAEYINQAKLKPFVAKCFDVSPDGVLAICERVYPITTISEFEAVADYVFDIIVFKLLGKYVVDDIGTKYFLNWGIREGVYPCLLDYPYVFELDSRKLYCNNTDIEGHVCLGEIDYDDGFNHLMCKKCGKVYKAFELSESERSNDNKLVILKGDSTMKVCLVMSNGEIYDPDISSDVIKKPEEVVSKEKRHEYTEKDLSSLVYISYGSEEEKEPEPVKETEVTDPEQEEVATEEETNDAITSEVFKVNDEEVKENTMVQYGPNGQIDISSNFIKSAMDTVSRGVVEDGTKPYRDSNGRFVSRHNEVSQSGKQHNKDRFKEDDDFKNYDKQGKKKTNPRRAAPKDIIDEY